MTTYPITLTVNRVEVRHTVPAELLLVDFIRDTLGLTGTHVGCDTSQCGACTVHVDGDAVKSCSILAVQADGATIRTIEGVAVNGKLDRLQTAFSEAHALQCGFCTPGMIMSALDLLAKHASPDDTTIREWLDGNLCRCTGYNSIVRAIAAAARS